MAVNIYSPMALTGPSQELCTCTHFMYRHDLFGCTAPHCSCIVQGSNRA